MKKNSFVHTQAKYVSNKSENFQTDQCIIFWEIASMDFENVVLRLKFSIRIKPW